MIEAKGVTKSYGLGESKTDVLKGIDLRISDGDFAVILGASGSGKSTLLNCLSGLERVDGGSIEYDGLNIAELSDKALTKFRKENIGFIFQQYYLLPDMTVDKNVRMGADLAGNADYREIIKAVGLEAKAAKYPSELSGGEQQRVSVARALAKKPKVLFLDEPTGALDEKTGRQVLDYICKLHTEYGFTIVMVTHNANIAEMANTVIRMNSGKLLKSMPMLCRNPLMRLGGNAMVIRLKDTAKLFGITIIACCAVFVCTLFLSYNIDLAAIKDEIVTEAGTEMYNAQVLMGRVIAAVSGGCLIATSVVMLLFYVKNYISTHGKELGILKALGYSNIKIARHFWVFGLSVFVGCAVGFVMGYLYLPTFYQKQAPNLQTLIPALKVQFHPLLTFALVGAPTIAFAVISVLFAYLKLKSPVLDLLRERQNVKVRIGRDGKENVPFLKDLRGVTLRSKKSLVFFVAFSAFCFSAMVQMSFSMDELASETFAVMVLSIGLILAFVTLFLSLSSVVKGNTKTIAMMRVFGYDDTTCSRCILGAYRPISYIGFAFGTVYQYGLLRMMVSVVFADIENMPEYGFDFKALTVTLILFVLTYELVMYLYSRSIKRLSVKSVMLE